MGVGNRTLVSRSPRGQDQRTIRVPLPSVVKIYASSTAGSGTGAALAGNPLCGEERSNGRNREAIPDNPYVHIASNAGPGIYWP